MDCCISADDVLRYPTPIGRPARLFARAVATIAVYTASWLDTSVSSASEWISLADTPFDANTRSAVACPMAASYRSRTSCGSTPPDRNAVAAVVFATDSAP